MGVTFTPDTMHFLGQRPLRATALTRELIVKAINVFDTGQHNETRSKIILMMNLEIYTAVF